MELSMRYQKALEYASMKHKNQYRIGGAPYITQPIGVAEIVREQGYPEDYQIKRLQRMADAKYSQLENALQGGYTDEK